MVKKLKVAAAVSVALCSFSAHSADITLLGDTINYVYDDSQLAITLFGTPTIVGDTVTFLPPSFRAESTNGEGAVVTAANFIFKDVYSLSGNSIEGIGITEFGDYEITGGDAVSASLLLTAVDLNNGGTFGSSSADFDASGDSGSLTTWSMSAVIDNPDFGQAIFSQNISLSIQNTLEATTNAQGEVAWIQKKLAFVASTDSGVLPPEIPIPAAAWLFGSALLGLMGVARKKRA